jgi:hypothetical protein
MRRFTDTEGYFAFGGGGGVAGFFITRYKYDCEAYNMYAQNGDSRKLNPAVINRYGSMTAEWHAQFSALKPKQRRQAEKIIFKNIFTDETCAVSDSAVGEVLAYYRVNNRT